MSNKEQYKDYARRYKQSAEKLKRTIDLKVKQIENLKLAFQQQKDIAIGCREEIRELKLKISRMNFWRDLFGIKTR